MRRLKSSDISDDFGSGGSHISPSGSIPIRDALRQLLDRAEGVLRAADAAAASSTSTDGLLSGARIYVETFRAYFAFDPASELVIDESTVLAAEVGRWLRDDSFIHPAWMVQFVESGVHINETSGSDESTGLAGAPLKSFAEVVRRIGKDAWIRDLIKCYLDTDVTEIVIPSSWTFLPTNGRNAAIIFYDAAPTVLKTGTIGAYQPQVYPTNARESITDAAGANMTAYVGAIFRMTSGPGTGAIFQALKVDAVTSKLYITTPINNQLDVGSFGLPTIASGNAYQVLQTRKVTRFVVGKFTRFIAFGSSIPGIHHVGMQDNIECISLQAESPVSIVGGALRQLVTAASFFAATLFLGGNGNVHIFNDGFGDLEGSQLYGCGLLNCTSFQVGSAMVLALNCQAQGCTELYYAGKHARVNIEGDLGVWDSREFLRVYGSNEIRIGDYISLYGTGNTGLACLRVDSDGTALVARSAVCTITGATNDWTLADESSLAPIADTPPYAYQAAQPTTWAKLEASIASGGFNGNAVHPPSGARIREYTGY